MMKLDIRLFAECEANTLVQLQFALMQALAAWQPVLEAPPRRYWKMPELFEFSFALGCRDAAALNKLLACVSAGWTSSGDADDVAFIWNRESGHIFLQPAVRWAEIQYQPGS